MKRKLGVAEMNIFLEEIGRNCCIKYSHYQEQMHIDSDTGRAEYKYYNEIDSVVDEDTGEDIEELFDFKKFIN